MAAALAAAASGTSQDAPPTIHSGQAAQLIEQTEQQFAEELRQVWLAWVCCAVGTAR